VAETLAADVVVVGAGPAGLAAAAHAAERGARVLLVDREPRPGGQVWRHRDAPPSAARMWIARVVRAGVDVRPDTRVIDAPADGRLLAEHGGRPLDVRYVRLVLATGARERFLPFPGWTLPGVVGVGGAQALLKQGARFDGLRVVVAGTGPLLPAVAAALAAAGARIVGIAEQAPFARLARFGVSLASRPGRATSALGFGMRLLGARWRTGAWVRSATGTEALEEVRGTDGRREWTWRCDVLACGFGLVPNLELARRLGCAVEDDAVVLDDAQRTTVPGVYAAGELGGIAGEAHALATGALAGRAAAGRPLPARLLRSRARERSFARALDRTFALRDELRTLAGPETVVCRCEDVTVGQIAPCRSGREAKLLTRAGMGPCQGRVCGPALAFLRGFASDSVRPPLEPTSAGALAEGWSTVPAPSSGDDDTL
jgi:NADPH-dependent 2,4-dienoyl-CoA reductase/sulfur reductase-like enzyme